MCTEQLYKRTKSRKGFTLVELVVVIAILGILAAIAIPIVINIVGSASDSAGKSSVSALDSACKSVYAGVQSGTINTTSIDANGNACTWAAVPGAGAYAKKAKANTVTLDEVQSYSGLSVSYGEIYPVISSSGNTGYAVGQLVYNEGGRAPTVAGVTFGAAVTGTTTLGGATGLY